MRKNSWRFCRRTNRHEIRPPHRRRTCDRRYHRPRRHSHAQVRVLALLASDAETHARGAAAHDGEGRCSAAFQQRGKATLEPKMKTLANILATPLVVLWLVTFGDVESW